MPSISKNKTLHNSIKDGAYYSLMVGMGETYLAAYVLEIGFGEIFSGLVTVIPMLIGAIAQLLSTVYKHKILAQKKSWVIRSVVIQALSLVIISICAFTKISSPPVIFILASIYWAAGLASVATWNAWLGNLIPRRIQIKYFSYRNQICYFYLLLGLIISGFTLRFFEHSSNINNVFGILFLTAGIARFISGYYLFLHREGKVKEKLDKNHFKKSIQKLKEKPILKLFGYVFFLQVATYISGPYVNPYLLNYLNLGYSNYMIAIGAALAARIIAYKYLGNFAKKRGAASLLMLGTLGVCPIPALWAISDNFFYIIGIQILSGIFWGAYELGIFFVLLNKYNSETRSDILIVLNFLNSFGMVVGSVIGAKVLEIDNVSGLSYIQIFLLSSLARILPLVMLSQLLDLPIFTKRLTKKFLIRIIGIRPTAGAIIRPILLEPKKQTTRPDLRESPPQVTLNKE